MYKEKLLTYFICLRVKILNYGVLGFWGDNVTETRVG